MKHHQGKGTVKGRIKRRSQVLNWMLKNIDRAVAFLNLLTVLIVLVVLILFATNSLVAADVQMPKNWIALDERTEVVPMCKN